ncbi:MAG: hypothetical protein K2V38_21090 [Gemmataceae bacterium]|nr:hypothetical protein [Gemmataceae bacterium]
MPFALPIRSATRNGVARVWVEVALTVLTSKGVNPMPFRVSTGSEITTVSEFVASALGLSAGGRSGSVETSAGDVTGRIVPVRFQFPPDPTSGAALTASSEWLIVPGTSRLCFLGFRDVHRYFTIETDDADMTFVERPLPLPI